MMSSQQSIRDHESIQARKADEKALSRLVDEAAKRTCKTRADFLLLLAREAYEAQRASPVSGLAHLRALKLEETLATFACPEWRSPTRDERMWAKDVLETIQCRAGLLKSDRESAYRFQHRSFQEYLAAVHLTSSADWVESALEWRGQPLADTEGQERQVAARESLWEVLRLACGHLAIPETDRPPHAHKRHREREAALPLLEQLIADPENNWTDVWLAGELWLELELSESPPEPWAGLKHRLQRRLVELVERGELSAYERTAAGRVLGHLGDLRPGVDLVAHGTGARIPDLDFTTAELPAQKKFTLAANGLTRVIPKRYRIARFPVTVSQFRAFATRENYAEEEWWGDALQAGCWEDGRLKVTDWTSRLQEWVTGPAELDSRFDVRNHPMVMVSWFEAVAFCRWFCAKRDLPDDAVRLPREAEWEQAARWSQKDKKADQRLYPWGSPHNNEDEKEHLSRHCNWSGAGIGGTSAVGLFPNGQSDSGALDMAGNVWEWCDDWSDEERKYRVLRGGSWGNDRPGILRAATRIYSHPASRSSNIGFRVVCVGESR